MKGEGADQHGDWRTNEEDGGLFPEVTQLKADILDQIFGNTNTKRQINLS